MLRSLLFLPGNSPNMLINGGYFGADGVIFDLEDAVALSEKDAARILVRNTLKSLDFGPCVRIVRVNAVDTPYFCRDVDALLPEKPALFLLPKAGSAEDIRRADGYLSRAEDNLGLPRNTVGLLALIETALGVENAFAIAAASSRVRGLFLGAEDLTADLQCKRTKAGREIEYARTRLVVAARAAGVEAYDTPFTDVNDDAGAETDAIAAKALGFSGKASISPRHVPLINRVFSPSREDIDYAYAVLDAIAQAAAQGKGVVSLRGKMVDAPIVARAKQTVAAAQALGLGREARV